MTVLIVAITNLYKKIFFFFFYFYNLYLSYLHISSYKFYGVCFINI